MLTIAPRCCCVPQSRQRGVPVENSPHNAHRHRGTEQSRECKQQQRAPHHCTAPRSETHAGTETLIVLSAVGRTGTAAQHSSSDDAARNRCRLRFQLRLSYWLHCSSSRWLPCLHISASARAWLCTRIPRSLVRLRGVVRNIPRIQHAPSSLHVGSWKHDGAIGMVG